MRNRGFTMIELVTVIAIVGALAVLVLPRLNVGGFQRYAFRQELLAGLRYAQKTAMASGCTVDIQVNASNFSLSYDQSGTATDCTGGGGTPGPVPDPAGTGGFTRTASGSVQVTSPGLVAFDGFGTPDKNKTTLTQITFANAPAIQIDATTGYIHE